jgi:hypothetical protein
MVSVLGMNTFGNVISVPLFSISRRSTLWEHLFRPQASDFEFLGLSASTQQRVGKLN